MLPSLEVTSLPRTELSSIFPGRGRQPSESCSFHALCSFLAHSTAWQTSLCCSWALPIPAQDSGLLCVQLETEGGMRQPWLHQHNAHLSSHHHLKVFLTPQSPKTPIRQHLQNVVVPYACTGKTDRRLLLGLTAQRVYSVCSRPK